MNHQKIRLLRMAEVLSKTRYQKSWIYRLISEDKFPKPIKLGERAVAFVEVEVDEWISEKISQSRN